MAGTLRSDPDLVKSERVGVALGPVFDSRAVAADRAGSGRVDADRRCRARSGVAVRIAVRWHARCRDRWCAVREPGDGAVRRWRRARFFFQAEDGIRDYKVTGVQTCALPI